MRTDPITRRQALQTSAAALLPLVAAPARGQQKPADLSWPTIGMATFGFPNHTNRQLAEELAHASVRVVQLFLSQTDSRYWKYNDRSDVSAMTTSRCQSIARAYRSAGVSIHSMGVYTNLIHPVAEERKANLAYFEAMMRIGEAMDVHVFVTEAGHYHTNAPEPPVPLHFQEQVWKQMVVTGRQLAEMAERHQAIVLFEPYYRGFLASAKRLRLFLKEVGSARLRALLDPANLLEVNDLEEMFDQLTPWIDCLHAKDRKLHVDQGVAAGQGDLDYPRFVTLARQRTPRAPLILEYVGPDNYKQALAHLRGVLRQSGAGKT